MKHAISLRPEGIAGSGPVRTYRVDAMPEGEEAKVVNFGDPHRNDWRFLRIKGNTQGDWIGNYASAEAALAGLQREVDQE
jgi:hypothetical protein